MPRLKRLYIDLGTPFNWRPTPDATCKVCGRGVHTFTQMLECLRMLGAS